MIEQHYNFAFLDERTKKRIRRALLKAVAVRSKVWLLLLAKWQVVVY